MYLDKTKRPIFKIICLGLSFVFIFSNISSQQALASRSKAGGGKLAEFDFSKLAISVGISLGSMAIGSAINSGLQNAYGQLVGQSSGQLDPQLLGFVNEGLISPVSKVATPGIWASMGGSLAKSFSVSNMASGLSTFSAVSQVGRAAGTMGNYYGWSPSTILIISNAASSATAGFLNPAIALGDAIPQSVSLGSESVQSAYYGALSTMAKGALVGGLTGLASSGAVVAIDADKINEGKEPGIPGQIAGLVAGVAAGNFARELVNPALIDGQVIRREKIAGRSAQEAEARLGISAEGVFASHELFAPHELSADGYFNITEASPQKILSKELLTGPALKEFADNRSSDKYKKTWLDENTLYLGKPGISAQGLFAATFIKTGDMWPQLTGRALSISATSLLGRDNRFASLAGSTVEGIATPLFSGLAEYYALKPGLYVGEEHISNSVRYLNNLPQSAYKVVLNEVVDKAYPLLKEYQKALSEIPKEDPKYEETYKETFKAYVDALEKAINEGINKDNKLYTDLSAFKDFAKPEDIVAHSREALTESGMKDQEINNTLRDLARQDFATKIFTTAMRDKGLKLETQMKDDIRQGKTTEEILKALGTDRFSLFWNSAIGGMKFGIVEGAVYGGISSLTAQLSQDSPLAGAAGAYAASLLTGAIRGVLWHKYWEPGLQDGRLVWSDRYSLPKPESPYRGDDWWQREFSKYKYAMDSERFNKFVAYLGLGPQKENIAELVFKDQRPDLTIAVLASLAQTNREFVNRTFAFGAPQIAPEHINTFIMSDYLNQVNGYAVSGSRPGWFSAGLTSGLRNAGSLSISNNLLTSLAAIKSTADALGIQRQRLTLTNSPLTGVTIQTLDYIPWAITVQTGFYLPFPSDTYRARSTTGESFIKDR